MSSRMLILFAGRSAVTPESILSSLSSSRGEYSGCSLSVDADAGAYSYLRELSLAALARRLLSGLDRLYSTLVRRWSRTGELGVLPAWSLSPAERPDWRLRGGGGGGGIEPVLSLETMRWLLRVEWTDDARPRPI